MSLKRKGVKMENKVIKKTDGNPKDLVPVEAFAPEKVIEEARAAARALQDVVRGKPKPVLIKGEQYLEFEDWQTLGRFYGISVGAVETAEIIREGKLIGFSAKATAWHNGVQVSAAEASCLRDEFNWKDKPEFQLKSMAQTRACAKALRNVLAWVAVLAGYKPTPAEEINGEEKGNGNGKCQYCGTTGKFHKPNCPGTNPPATDKTTEAGFEVRPLES